jgi:hypothetical protein
MKSYVQHKCWLDNNEDQQILPEAIDLGKEGLFDLEQQKNTIRLKFAFRCTLVFYSKEETHH